jgi:succinoglycan biosynthesis protein ExoA
MPNSLSEQVDPFVTVIMPIRNEALHIAHSLGAVLAQDYPPDRMEVIVVDGRSTDRTCEIVQALIRPRQQCANDGERGCSVHLLDNPGRITATALNIGIKQSRGDIIACVDGHTVIAPDYVRQFVEALRRTHADNVGGTMTTIGTNRFGKAVSVATSTSFGVGSARFHYSTSEEWVDTTYLGAWPREVFARIGLFDEELVRDQDDEFNYRLRKHGGRILHSPLLRLSYTGRSRPSDLWSQYLQYGFWKVRVLQKNPRQMQLRQFVPPLLVASLIGSALLALLTNLGLILLALVGGTYLAANLLASGLTAWRKRSRLIWLLPLVFGILHISYGLGFLGGLLYFWNRWGDRTGRTPTWDEALPATSDLDRLRAEYADRERRLAGRDRYSFFNPSYLFRVQQTQRAVLTLLSRHGVNSLAGKHSLEVGCGAGGELIEYLNYDVKPGGLHGTDLLFGDLKVAHVRLPHVPLTNADAQHLPYQSAAFDLVLQYTVFSSILDTGIKAQLAREMLRVLKPGGLIVWYDFWLNPTNPQTAGIRPAEVRQLFPECAFEFRRITLAPPLARKLVPVSWWWCGLLENLRVFNTHYLVAIRRNSE